MNPLVKCPHCERHTNPILGGEYVQRTGKPTIGGKRNMGTYVCEYCGWKLTNLLKQVTA